RTNQTLRMSVCQQTKGKVWYLRHVMCMGSQGAQSSCCPLTPNPEKQPMPFFRRMAQIHKTYSAAWRDLDSLCEIKTGDAYWPIMARSFTDAPLTTDTDFQSGITFCEQLRVWAQDKLADQATCINDIVQDKLESVEKYHSRLTQTFSDLGWSERSYTHQLTQVLTMELPHHNTVKN
ncbi:Hypothetical predicted protein, partial [Pelobates cultripes]